MLAPAGAQGKEAGWEAGWDYPMNSAPVAEPLKTHFDQRIPRGVKRLTVRASCRSIGAGR
jgi:hypothetical protein